MVCILKNDWFINYDIFVVESVMDDLLFYYCNVWVLGYFMGGYGVFCFVWLL